MTYCNYNNENICTVCGHVAPVAGLVRRCGRGVSLRAIRDRPFVATEDVHLARPVRPKTGPGTELKKLLARVGIAATPNCSCNARARQMDEWGVEEAAKPERIEQAVAWLREEAERRGLPFVDMAGRMLVRRAIANARKNQLTE